MSDVNFSKYSTFINEYFPNSGVSGSPYLIKIYEIVNRNIHFMKLIKKIDSDLHPERQRLYDDFHLLSLRMLYHLPSNDEFINNIIVRATSENILRIVLSFIDEKCTDIISLSYSSIMDSLAKKGFSQRYPDLHKKLSNYFGNYSKDVHGQNLTKLSEKEYLVSIREENNEKHLSKLYSVYDKISLTFIPCILSEMDVKKKTIPTGILSEMLNLVGEEVYYKYFSS
ncbi:hypothetical protein [Lysinibacillus sp. NPDC096212]|uniref:hypothetical protein n=1 Tax=Lysinibacillus sp. NPDC096212 TaxID=3364135 RepID=UPI00380A9A90